MSVEQRTEYRVMARRPGGNRYEYVTKVRSLEGAQRHKALAERGAHGWMYRIDQRSVSVTSTPWKPASGP